MQITRIILLMWMMLIPVQQMFSQHISRSIYTGAWEAPTSWNPVWPVPITGISGFDITINGFITVNGPLSFSGPAYIMTVNDTLVVKGNLSFSNNYNLTINDNGILFVIGDLYIDNETDISANGYLIVTGNIIKVGSLQHGSLISNDNPAKVFIFGTPNVGTVESNYPVLNCPAVSYNQYPNSQCSYGNILDLLSNPVNSFIRSIYIKVTASAGTSTVCAGESIQLNSVLTGGSGSYSYTWTSIPSGFTSSSADPVANPVVNTKYKVTVSNDTATGNSEVSVTVNALPAKPVIGTSGNTTFCSGGNVTLTSNTGTSYLWSNGAVTPGINVTSSGSYSVQVTNSVGCKSAVSIPVKVIVNEMPVSVAGDDHVLKYCFETQMEADLTSSLIGEWAVISGSGNFADIHSPVTTVTNLSVGENVFSWKVSNGICEALDEVTITVLDLFIPSVITPDGDGKNDFFKVSYTGSNVERCCRFMLR